MKNLKIKLPLVDTLSLICGTIWRLVVTIVTLGLAGHLLYNYQYNFILERTELKEHNIAAKYEMTWGNYVKYLWLPFIVYCVIVSVSLGVTTLLLPAIGGIAFTVYVLGIIFGITYMVQQQIIGSVTALKVETLCKENVAEVQEDVTIENSI